MSREILPQCHRCKDSYEKGEKPFYGQDSLWFCSHCYDLLRDEKLLVKKIKTVACKSKKKSGGKKK